MSASTDNQTYVRPEYTPLFSQIQDYIADALNSDPQISSTRVKFYPEHILDIEYQIRENLGKQGCVGIVNTLAGEYGGHNGTTQAWEIQAEIDIFENPSIRRAEMKRNGLSVGTTADLIDWVQESICGPASPTYGKFCSVSQKMGEDSGLVVGKSVMKTYALADVSGIVSGESGWRIPYALWSDLSALSVQVQEISAGYLKLVNDSHVTLDVSRGMTVLGDIWATAGNQPANLWDFNYIGVASTTHALGLGDILYELSTSSGEGKYVPLSSDQPISISAIGDDGGFSVVLGASNTPYFRTGPLMTTMITKLSAADMELGPNGYFNRFIPNSQTYALSSWNWLKTQEHGMGDVLSSMRSQIMDDVAEDYVSYNWIEYQPYVKRPDLSAYLPLSGGDPTGRLKWSRSAQFYTEVDATGLVVAQWPRRAVQLDSNGLSLSAFQTPYDQLDGISFTDVRNGNYNTLADMVLTNNGNQTLSGALNMSWVSVSSLITSDIVESGRTYYGRDKIWAEEANYRHVFKLPIKQEDQNTTLATLDDLNGFPSYADLSAYLPLSGGVMNNGAVVTFYDEQDNKTLELDGQNGRIVGEYGSLDNFTGFTFDGILKYSLTDSAEDFTPQMPEESSMTVMRGGDVFAVIGDISALIHNT